MIAEISQLSNAVPLWANLILVAVGMGWHAAGKLAELERLGRPTDASEYLMNHKWTAVSVVMGAYLLFIIQWYTGEGGPIAAVLTGISCNSAGDKLRARAEAGK